MRLGTNWLGTAGEGGGRAEGGQWRFPGRPISLGTSSLIALALGTAIDRNCHMRQTAARYRTGGYFANHFKPQRLIERNGRWVGIKM